MIDLDYKPHRRTMDRIKNYFDCAVINTFHETAITIVFKLDLKKYLKNSVIIVGHYS